MYIEIVLILQTHARARARACAHTADDGSRCIFFTSIYDMAVFSLSLNAASRVG